MSRYSRRYDEIYTVDDCNPYMPSASACNIGGSCSSGGCEQPSLPKACDPCDPCDSDACETNACIPGGPGASGPCDTGARCCDLNGEPRIQDCVWQVSLDMTCYDPEDIVVYAENNKLTILAQKRQPVELFAIPREFKRCYDIPLGYSMDDVAVYISSDCILIITIPCKVREYPIQPIGPVRCFIMACTDSCSNNKSCCVPPDQNYKPC